MWMNRLQTILQTLRDRGLWQPLLVTLAFLFLLLCSVLTPDGTVSYVYNNF